MRRFEPKPIAALAVKQPQPQAEQARAGLPTLAWPTTSLARFLIDLVVVPFDHWCGDLGS